MPYDRSRITTLYIGCVALLTLASCETQTPGTVVCWESNPALPVGIVRNYDKYSSPSSLVCAPVAIRAPVRNEFARPGVAAGLDTGGSGAAPSESASTSSGSGGTSGTSGGASTSSGPGGTSGASVSGSASTGPGGVSAADESGSASAGPDGVSAAE